MNIMRRDRNTVKQVEPITCDNKFLIFFNYLLLFIFSVFLTAILTYCFRSIYFVKSGVKISFNLQYGNKDEQRNHWQLFYLIDGKKKWYQTKWIIIENSNTLNYCEMIIPCKTLNRIRFDFGWKPGAFAWNQIKLQGNETISLKDMKKTSSFQVKDLKIQSDRLTGESFEKDPYVWFELKTPLKGRMFLDYWSLLIIAVPVLIVIFAVLAFIFRGAGSGNKLYSAELVLIILFLTALFIPFSNMDNKKISETEKRRLAQYKPLITAEGKINFQYGKNFDSWFNDLFFGRTQLLDLNSFLQSRIMNMSRNVYKGFDNWNFYVYRDSMQNYHNLKLFSQKSLLRAAEDINKIHAICQRKGKKIYIVVVPEKHKVYGQYYPAAPKIRPDDQSRARQFEKFLKTHTSVPVIYLLDVLLKNKNIGLLYWKNDSHWNEMGAYLGYLEIMAYIQKDFPQLQPYKIHKIAPAPPTKIGDLFLLSNGCCPTEPTVLYPLPSFDKNYTAKGDPIERVLGFSQLINPNGKLNVLILRDSFAISLLPYIGNTFHSVKTLWKGYELPPNYLNTFHEADIVIFECVERLLPIMLEGIHATRITLEQGVK